jgi:hypothetical protein
MRRLSARLTLAAAGVIIAIAACVLLAMGRNPWMETGSVKLWTSDAWGPENSQQLFDPYSFTHVIHGVLLYVVLRFLMPHVAAGTRAIIAVAAEAGWEVFENTDAVINRYRAATLALGYYGDSVVNSVGDILMCALGFALAARLPARATVLTTIVLELVLLLWIRDNLSLNLLMLAYPIDAIKRWQLNH